MELDFERCYRAVDSRDQRFDGWFYTAVRTTGIYCRPSCPATTPKRQNVTFYPSAAAAQRGGFRACRRCRPDAAPGSPEWDVRADVVGRAMRLIGDGVVDREGIPGLAGRLGYTERHLHRMLTAELGAGPLALARAQRAQTARILIETTDLGLAEIAFAAGFGSVRQFNDTILEVYARPPGALRERRPQARPAARTPGAGPIGAGPVGAGPMGAGPMGAGPIGAGPIGAGPVGAGPVGAGPVGAGPVGAGSIGLRLAYRAPLHAEALLGFLAARALPGVEECDGRSYRRGLSLPHGSATVELTPADRWVSATLWLTDVRDLAPAVARCRRLFDLDADPVAVDGTLAADPALAGAVRAEPGVRVPRAVDGFETAVRAVVGQQVSVAGARTTLIRMLRAAAAASARSSADSPAGAEASRASSTSPARASQAASASQTASASHAAPASAAASGRAGRLAGDGGLVAFPGAEVVAELPDSAFGMPVARRETIRALAQAVADGKLDLEPGADRDEAVARLQDLPGVGAWTAGYVAMRAIGDPDVFLPTDLAARRGARNLGLPDAPKALAEHAERWRPWRSYALIRLWRAA